MPIYDAYIIFQKGVDKFEIYSTKHTNFWFGVQFLLKRNLVSPMVALLGPLPREDIHVFPQTIVAG